MSLDNLSREELQELSMIDIASMILHEEKKAITYQDIYQKVVELKQFNDVEQAENLAQFYTDLNTDGRFLSVGSGLWGLRDWYPVEQIEEEVTGVQKKKKKKKKTTTKKAKKEEKYTDTDNDITEEELDFDQSNFDDEDDTFDSSSSESAEDEDFDQDFDDFDDESLDDDYEDDEDDQDYDEEDDDSEEENK
ncbi:DNA-directed RNA polymerase subunit delta [Paraliobacillus ryukyuensis]|uniref:Probable DNA-directed RNA polymerase subunit delta n=1 Tax=Paraliobacillus ryukyuensis TaxID=200904 RepID=A0A366EDN8_9BACI|nr:DNA-directed RNA polymerase subunit delta [Paraliobacillus ryukyuensis]RBP00521.1 DNA-directed RNA polymerase subunit delta [Paraliobacillus ryukyuensis]